MCKDPGVGRNRAERVGRAKGRQVGVKLLKKVGGSKMVLGRLRVEGLVSLIIRWCRAEQGRNFGLSL